MKYKQGTCISCGMEFEYYAEMGENIDLVPCVCTNKTCKNYGLLAISRERMPLDKNETSNTSDNWNANNIK